MVTAYINHMPHILILCIHDVAEGEEFFLDYGEQYTSMYLQPKTEPEPPKQVRVNIYMGVCHITSLTQYS